MAGPQGAARVGREPEHQCESPTCVPDAQHVYYSQKARQICFIRLEGRPRQPGSVAADGEAQPGSQGRDVSTIECQSMHSVQTMERMMKGAYDEKTIRGDHHRRPVGSLWL